MKLKKFFKNKKEKFIIIFLNGQILYTKISIVLTTLLNILHKPKYDFWMH